MTTTFFKRFVMIIDTETANSVKQPLPYDIGWIVLDTWTGEIVTKYSYAVAEIFCDKELMASAYYAKKLPRYEEEIKNGKRILKSFCNIKKILWDCMKVYDITQVGAYNCNFDKRAMNNDARLITGSFYRWAFPYGTEFFDIWQMACTSFMRSKWFIKWAIKNKCVSAAGNIKTTAEVAYQYIIKYTGFEEEHVGIEDVLIEAEIFLHVIWGRMKYDTSVKSQPWRNVQKYRKQFVM